jgi:S-adenosylmethionine hydrolase
MIVTLTSDFSDSGGFIAQLKAKILELFGEIVTIIDITHNIAPFNYIEAAYITMTTIPKFPNNSIHIVVVDPGVGSKRNIVAAKFQSQFIIAPDNEIFSMIEPDITIKIDKTTINPNTPKTFEAYSIMAPAAYVLYKHGIKNIGKPTNLTAPKLFPIKRKGLIKGKIVYIDRFGNCISNVDAHLLKEGFQKIRIKNITFNTLSSTYSTGTTPHKALINSSYFLEFAIYKDSFANKFKINYLDSVEIFL